MASTVSDKQIVCLNKMSFLMSKILLARNFRRRCNSFRRRHCAGDRLSHLYRTRKIYARLFSERMLYLKMLLGWVQAHSFRPASSRNQSEWYEKNVSVFTDAEWQEHFKMSKKTFLSLVEVLEPYLHSEVVTVDKRVAITLFALSSGSRIDDVAERFGVTKQTVSSSIRDVCNTIIKALLSSVVKVPRNEALIQCVNDFETKWGFPYCAGVLSNIHIPVYMAKLPENSSDYINNDGGYSIYLQGIVDPSYKFWDINIGWPGSVKESRILTTSELWLQMQDGTLFPRSSKMSNGTNMPVILLANSSYPLTSWLMRPFQITDTSPPENLKFNEALKFAHSAADVCFKRLKARWNCLVTGNICSIDDLPNVATACCILHNVCEDAKEPMLDKWIIQAESLYKQPLPTACCSIIGSNAEMIQQAFREYINA